ncbi:MAG: hypothetical protein KTR30_01245 [Saprospiraceae bacterium]|nr:hypothetical protein [Saprospiraceae bacterium]
MEEYLVQAQELAEQLTLQEWAYIGGGFLFFLIIIMAIRRSRKGRKVRVKKASNIHLHSFQIAPLGRDAFVKIRNTGEAAVLSGLKIVGRDDMVIKNAFAGQKIDQNKEYGIFLEVNGREKIQPGFLLEVTVLGPNGQVQKSTLKVANS